MFSIVARSAHTQEIIIIKRQVRPVVQMLDVVDYIALAVAPRILAPLTLMVVPLQDLKSLPDPDAGLIEVVGYRYPPAMSLPPDIMVDAPGVEPGSATMHIGSLPRRNHPRPNKYGTGARPVPWLWGEIETTLLLSTP
jgi:hypothetical protein